MIKLTTDHSTSSYGTPVFVDEYNNALDYAEGLRRLIAERKWGTQKQGCEEIAKLTGVSTRTAEGWLQGRMPQKHILILLAALLKK